MDSGTRYVDAKQPQPVVNEGRPSVACGCLLDNVMSRRARTALVALLTLLAAHHLGKGFYFLVLQRPATAIADLRNRQVENAYFLDRVSPLSQQFLSLESNQWARGADVHWTHGAETAHGALPPWTYPMQLAVVPPAREQVARVYLAALNVVALGLMGWIALLRMNDAGADPTSVALVVVSPLAIGAINNALTQGSWRSAALCSK